MQLPKAEEYTEVVLFSCFSAALYQGAVSNCFGGTVSSVIRIRLLSVLLLFYIEIKGKGATDLPDSGSKTGGKYERVKEKKEKNFRTLDGHCLVPYLL